MGDLTPGGAFPGLQCRKYNVLICTKRLRTSLMKQEYLQHSRVHALGLLFREIMTANDCPWDECLFRQEALSPGQTSFDYTYRTGRRLDFIPDVDPEKKRRLKHAMAEVFDAIAALEGKPPKVAVLSVQADGSSRFFHDSEAGSMDITVHAVGLRHGWFTRAQIDPAAFVLEELAEAEKWERLLADGVVFELAFLVADFGFPCPDSLRAVEDALARALTGADIGKVLAIDYQSIAGAQYARLRIGVVDQRQGAERIASLMRDMRAPASTTLTLIAPHAQAYDLRLKPRAALVVEHTNHLIAELVRESIRCAPGWDSGTLKIASDGSRVEYRLVNEASPERPAISRSLIKLCEELSVIRWKSGDKWTGATLAYRRAAGKVDYELAFSYDAPARATAGSDAAPLLPKPWWKWWARRR